MQNRSLHLAASLFVGLSSCVVGTAPASAKDKLLISTASGGASAVAVTLAKEIGAFDAAGLDVSVFDAGGGNNGVSTLVNGEAQIAVVGIRNASKPVEKGLDLKLIAVETNALTQVIFVRADLFDPAKPPVTLADKGALLRGKKIAVNDIGGSSGEFARYVLAAGGAGERDASILNMNSAAARLTALRSGRIDAIVGSSPEPDTAVVEGFGRILVDPIADVPEFRDIASTVHLVRNDYLKANGPLLARYLGAVEKARRLIAAEPNQAKSAYFRAIAKEANGTGLRPDIEASAWKSAVAALAPSPVLSAGQYDRAQLFFKIPKAVSYQQFVDTALASSALASTSTSQ